MTNYRTAIEASLQSMRKRKFDIVCLASWLTDRLFSSHHQVWSALLCTFEPLNHPWWWRSYTQWNFWTQFLSDFQIFFNTYILLYRHRQVWSALPCTFKSLNHPWWWRSYEQWNFWTQFLSDCHIITLNLYSTIQLPPGPGDQGWQGSQRKQKCIRNLNLFNQI